MSPSRPVTEGRRRALALRGDVVHWLVVVAIALSSLALRGYRYHGQDNDMWIPAVVSLMDADSYPGDGGVRSRQRDLSPYPKIMAVLARPLGLPWTFFLVYLAARLTLFVSVAAIAGRVAGKTVAILAVVLLCYPNPIGATGILTVSDLLLPRFIGVALGLVAVSAALAARHVAAGLSLAAAFAFHPPSVIPLGLGVLVVALRCQKHRWRGVLTIASLTAVTALPLTLSALSLPASTSTLLSEDQRWEILREYHGLGLIDSWLPLHWLMLLPSAVAFLLPACLPVRDRERELRTSLLVGAVVAAFCLLVSVAGQELRLALIVRMILIRGLMLPVLLAHVHLAVVTLWSLRAGRLPAAVGAASFLSFLSGFWGHALILTVVQPLVIARRAQGVRRRLALGISLISALILGTVGASFVFTNFQLRPERGFLVLAAAGVGVLFASRDLAARRSVVTGAAFVLLLVLLGWQGGLPRIDWPWREPVSQWTELARWADGAASKDARFAIVPYDRGFRAIVRRSALVESTDANTMAWTDEGALEFFRRADALRPRPLHELVRALEEHEADYLVVPTSHPRLPFPRVHADSAWTAYELPGR